MEAKAEIKGWLSDASCRGGCSKGGGKRNFDDIKIRKNHMYYKIMSIMRTFHFGSWKFAAKAQSIILILMKLLKKTCFSSLQ